MPSPAACRTTSRGKYSRASQSAALGASCSAANWRALSWIASCSSLSAKSMASSPPLRGLRPRLRVHARHELGTVDDRALVETGADHVGVVAALDLEAQLAALDRDQLDLGRHRQADRRGGTVAHVHVGGDRLLVRPQVAAS